MGVIASGRFKRYFYKLKSANTFQVNIYLSPYKSVKLSQKLRQFTFGNNTNIKPLLTRINAVSFTASIILDKSGRFLMNRIKTTQLISIPLIGLLGCASTPPAPKDTSALNETSVVKAKIALNGLIVPDLSGKQVTYTRSDRRHVSSKQKFDSFFMRWANNDSGEITRIDKNIVWHLNHDDKKYRECTLSGCQGTGETGLWDRMNSEQNSQSSEQQGEYESYEEKSCQVTLKSNQFDIKETGKTRTISEFKVKEYVIDWKIEFEDENKNVDLSQVNFVFWNTDPTQAMKSEWKTHIEFSKNKIKAMNDNPFVNLLGDEGYQAISTFMGDVENNDAAKFKQISKKLNNIKGYPISLKLEWFQKNEACQPEKVASKDEGIDLSNGISGAAKSLFGGFVSKKKDNLMKSWMKEPMVRYVYEIQSVQQKPVHDSKFNVPANYELTDRQ